MKDDMDARTPEWKETIGNIPTLRQDAKSSRTDAPRSLPPWIEQLKRYGISFHFTVQEQCDGPYVKWADLVQACPLQREGAPSEGRVLAALHDTAEWDIYATSDDVRHFLADVHSRIAALDGAAREDN